nr:hypothetical protein [Thiothrix nivea]
MFTGQPDRPKVADWCFGYTCGVELDEEAWDAMPDDLQDLLDLILWPAGGSGATPLASPRTSGTRQPGH